MATVTATQPIDMLSPVIWEGDVTLSTSSKITIDDHQGHVANYYGSFQYLGNVVIVGTLTGFSQSDSNGLDFTVSDFSVPAPLAYVIIQSDDAQAAWRAVLSGDDMINGSAGSDILDGFDGNDQFRTGTGFDTVFGGKSDDIFIYSAQDNDTFFGESGFDVVLFDGDRADYTVTRLDYASHAVEHIGGTDDIAVNTVERLMFANHEVIALDVDAGGDAGTAYRMYQAALDRAPDETGLAVWINYLDMGGSAGQMAQLFINSAEFIAHYGNTDDTTFVNQLYNNVLNRAGEPGGGAGWVNGLQHDMTRAQVLLGFSESAENVANVAPRDYGRHQLQ